MTSEPGVSEAVSRAGGHSGNTSGQAPFLKVHLAVAHGSVRESKATNGPAVPQAKSYADGDSGIDDGSGGSKSGSRFVGFYEGRGVAACLLSRGILRAVMATVNQGYWSSGMQSTEGA